MSYRAGRGAVVVMTMLVPAASLPAKHDPPPLVERITGTERGSVPGAGSVVLKGAFGVELVEYGSLEPVAPTLIEPLHAVEKARSYAGLPKAKAWAFPLALSIEAGENSNTSVKRRFGFAVDLVELGSVVAWRVYIDGHGHPVGIVPLVKGAYANVYKRSPSHSSADVAFLDVLGKVAELDDGSLRVSGCGPEPGGAICEFLSFATPDEHGDWLFGPVPADPLDPFAEVNAFWQLHTSKEALAEMGLDHYSRGVHAVVNYQSDESGDGELEPFLNAMYVPRMFGDADGLVFGYTGAGSLAHDADVLRHELVHAATVHLADLNSTFDEYGYDHHPAVIAETVADYYAAALSGDPAVAVHTGLLLGMGEGGVRRLDLDLHCPDDLIGRPHHDAQVVAGALWRAREAVGKKMDEVVATALKAMPLQPSIGQAAISLLAAASVHLGAGGHERVRRILEEAGVTSCSRFRDLEVGTAAMGQLPFTRQMGSLSPGPFQYRFRVPHGTGTVIARLQRLDGEDAIDGVLHARVGSPVRYLRREEVAGGMSLEIVYESKGQAEVEIDEEAWSHMNEPIIFLGPANSSEFSWMYRIEVFTKESDEVSEPTGHAPSSAIDSGGDSPGGCGRSAPFGVVLLLLWLPILKKRQARS